MPTKEKNNLEVALDQVMANRPNTKANNVPSEKGKFTRWGRKDDKEAFQKIIKFCKDNSLSLDEILREQNPQRKNIDDIWDMVAEICDWKRESIHLKLRFQKLYNASKFSVREMKQLKRLVRKQKRKGEIDWNYIAYHFPGKTIEGVKNGWEEEKRTRPYKRKFNL